MLMAAPPVAAAPPPPPPAAVVASSAVRDGYPEELAICNSDILFKPPADSIAGVAQASSSTMPTMPSQELLARVSAAARSRPERRNRSVHEIVIDAVADNGYALEYVSEPLKSDPQVIAAAISRDPLIVHEPWFPEALREDCEAMLAAAEAESDVSASFCGDNAPWTAECAHELCGPGEEERFQGRAIMLTQASSVAMALELLNSDPNLCPAGFCIVASESHQRYFLVCRRDRCQDIFAAFDLEDPAGLISPAGTGFDEAVPDWSSDLGAAPSDLVAAEWHSEIVVSQKYEPGASPFVAMVERRMAGHEAFRNFTASVPLSACKEFCGPYYQDTDSLHECRGTCGKICTWPNCVACGDGPEPTAHSCWRYAFRHRLERAARLGGFMLQVIERSRDPLYGRFRGRLDLNDGQALEEMMAESVGIKVFRLAMPEEFWPQYDEAKVDPLVDELAERVSLWSAGPV